MSDENIAISQLLGVRLQNIRRSKKMTQEELASKIGKSTNYLSDLERGKKSPSLMTLIDMMQVLKITPNEIFCDFIQETDEELSEISRVYYDLSEIERQYLLKFARGYQQMLHAVKNSN